MNRALIALLLLVAACHGDLEQRRLALAAAPARRLVGVWDATLWLDRPVTLQSDSRTLPRRLSGSLAFLEDHAASVSTDELSDLTHVGVYDIDFRSFGFQLYGSNGFPTAAARTTTRASTAAGTPDSVWIVLDPGSGRGGLRLAGTFAADSIAGVWTTAQSLGGGGRFSLRPHAP